MPRILAFDYGGKRTGIAVTDPMQMIATALGTVDTKDVMDYLKTYCAKEEVETFVVGQPFRMDGSTSDIEVDILKFIEKLKTEFPDIPVRRMDESFTSRRSMQSLIASGVKKKDRRDKRLLDSVSATLILQDYLATK
ncbi:MAG TPA: Holliday junction resolvase RuvX [Bacteroidetes bacterium]|nr:Holliday junction resolvase RuvX [Bacteroidota bacterium]